MKIDPRDKDPRDNNAGRESERLIDQI